MKFCVADNDCSNIIHSSEQADPLQGPAAESQFGFSHRHSYRSHGQLGFYGGAKTAATSEPAAHKLKDSIRAVGKLGFSNQHELAQPPFHMTYRRFLDAPSTPATAQVSPSIVVIIIVLTVIFFLSAFLHLLIRWLARNPALMGRGGVRARVTGTEPGSNNRIIALTALQGQLQQLFSMQDAGLERALIEELPVFSFKAAMGALKEGADCAICLCEFEGDDELRLLPSCGHAFHTDCIDTWLISHSTCPLCRTLLLPECWMPGSFQPLVLSAEASEAGHQQQLAIGTAVPQSGGVVSHGSSSRRSSLGRRITILAGSNMTVDETSQSRQGTTAELDRESTSNRAEGGSSIAPTDSSMRSYPSSGLASFGHGKAQNSINQNRCSDASSKPETGSIHAVKSTSAETANSEMLNPMLSSSSAALMLADSGRLSYTSVGNNADAQSGRYSDLLDRASTYGSGRRVSLHLGKCRVINEHGKGSKSSGGGASRRRSYSKGCYEYVIDSSSNLEVLIPLPSKPPTLISSSRFNDLLNLSHRLSASLAAADTLTSSSAASNGPNELAGKTATSPSWTSESFRKLRLCHGCDTDACMEEAVKVPLNTSQPSDMPIDYRELSGASSLRANVGSDTSFSPASIAQKLRDLSCTLELTSQPAHNSCNQSAAESSDRAVSFRLPTPASHHVLSAKLRAISSRRSLSESEALSHWEPTFATDEDGAQADHVSNNRMLILDQVVGRQGSSSFAKRTMDWLVSWPRRMVHPVANSG